MRQLWDSWWCGLLLIGVSACEIHMYELKDDSTPKADGGGPVADERSEDTSEQMENDNEDSDTASDSADPSDVMVQPLELDPIDDMEDGSGRILAKNGRYGFWYVMDDANVIVWPPLTSSGEPALTERIPGGRSCSSRAMHIKGGCDDLDRWDDDSGAGVGFDLRYNSTGPISFDASVFNGIAFWGRSEMEMDIPLRVRSITDTSTETVRADDGLERVYSTAGIPLTEAWRKYWVFFRDEDHLVNPAFSPFEGEYWDGAFNARELLSVQFYFNHATRVGFFDFWIDDISFFKGRPDCGLDAAVCLFDVEGLENGLLM